MVLCVLLLFFMCFTTTYAATFEITKQPDSIDATIPFEIDFSFTCESCELKPNYFFGVFKPEDSSYQFGFTNVADEWVNYETQKDASHYVEASPSAEGVWRGTLQVKAIDTENISARFKGQGKYLLRVLRFTPGTTSHKVEVPITLQYLPPPTPTPHPTAAPTPTPSPKPTVTPSPIPRPSPSPSPTMSPLPKKHVIVTAASASTEQFIEVEASEPAVLGAVETPDSSKSVRKPATPLFFIGGSILILLGIIPVGIKLVSGLQ